MELALYDLLLTPIHPILNRHSSATGGTENKYPTCENDIYFANSGCGFGTATSENHSDHVECVSLRPHDFLFHRLFMIAKL